MGCLESNRFAYFARLLPSLNPMVPICAVCSSDSITNTAVPYEKQTASSAANSSKQPKLSDFFNPLRPIAPADALALRSGIGPRSRELDSDVESDVDINDADYSLAADTVIQSSSLYGRLHTQYMAGVSSLTTSTSPSSAIHSIKKSSTCPRCTGHLNLSLIDRVQTYFLNRHQLHHFVIRFCHYCYNIVDILEQ